MKRSQRTRRAKASGRVSQRAAGGIACSAARPKMPKAMPTPPSAADQGRASGGGAVAARGGASARTGPDCMSRGDMRSPPLMGHQDRQRRRRDDVARRAAEDHLAQPALGIGALDQEIGAEARGLFEHGLADAAAMGGTWVAVAS